MRAFLWVLFILMVFIAGCGDWNKAEEGTGTVVTFPFPVLSQNDIDEIRTSPSRIDNLYEDFRERAKGFHHALFSQSSDDELSALFSAIVAYSMAPYGNSTEVEFTKLLKEEKLDCDNYAILTYYLFLDGTEVPTDSSIEFRFVGWDGGAVGNHAQIFIVSRQRSILLDPTIGIAVIADFNSVASGKPLPSSSQIIDFSTRTELKDYRQKVIDALVHGRYKPSDLLYYFEEFEEFRNPSVGSVHWPTPGAYSLRKRKQ